MRAYEVTFVLQPSLDEDLVEEVVKRFQQLIQDRGGSVDEVDLWGRRRLAYEIADQREGYYVVLKFHGDDRVIKELDRVMKMAEGVLRHLIVSLEEV